MVIADNKFRSMGFSYDANGRQVKATKANVADAWSVYDALGNRVATKVNDIWQFVIYDAFGKLVAEYGNQGEGVGGVSYVLQDWQGSVRASVNNNGFIQARFDFTAFGEEVSLGVGLRSLEQGYTGDATTKQGYGLTEKDSSGQNHTWFRKQEQKAGRWTSPDPYNGSMDVDNPQSFNRYSYVENDAVNFVDPSGLQRRLIAYNCWCVNGDVPGWTDPNPRCQTCYIWVEDGTGYNNSSGNSTFGGGGNIGSDFIDRVKEKERNKTDKQRFIEKCVKRMIKERLAANDAERQSTLNKTFVKATIIGAGSGAVTGGVAGAAVGGVGAVPGAIIGGVGGAVGGILSTAGYEATFGRSDHASKQKEAAKPTKKDEDACRSEAMDAGL
jgi:RHS repeat-associated protein